MAPILFYRIQMGTVLFGGAVKKEMRIFASFSTNTVHGMNFYSGLMEMEGYHAIIDYLESFAYRMSRRPR
jgi:hypothetical protein